MGELWERLEGEDTREFEAFTWYRDMVPSLRSIRNAAARSLKHPVPFRPLDHAAPIRRAVGSRTNSWERNSLTFSWPQRVQAWDDHLDAIRRMEQTEHIVEMRDRQAASGRAILNAALQAVREIVQGSEDGTREARTIGDFPSADRVILAWATHGAQLERAAYGLNVPQDDPDGRVANPQDVPREIYDEGPEVVMAAAQLALARVRADRERREREEAKH